jgi:hypothetical protein
VTPTFTATSSAATNQQSIGSAVEDILLIAECMPEDEIRRHVAVFLPFRG